MTYSKFFLLGAILAIGLAIVKVFFISALNIESSAVFYSMYVVIALFSIAMARRVGVIMYIEATFLSIMWTVMSLFADALIAKPLIAAPVFSRPYFWMTYLVMFLAIFVAHKKRHVVIRKEIKSGHHNPTH